MRRVRACISLPPGLVWHGKYALLVSFFQCKSSIKLFNRITWSLLLSTTATKVIVVDAARSVEKKRLEKQGGVEFSYDPHPWILLGMVFCVYVWVVCVCILSRMNERTTTTPSRTRIQPSKQQTQLSALVPLYSKTVAVDDAVVSFFSLSSKQQMDNFCQLIET